MNEFNKPFEYFEEEGVGGIMLVLFFMLVSVEPLLGVISAFILTDAFKGSSALMTGFICASTVFILLSFICGIALKKVRRYALVLTKGFLAYRLLYMGMVVYINLVMRIDAIQVPKETARYISEYNSCVTSFIISISYVVIFSVGWYIYLGKSKRVRELFPKNGEKVQATS